MDHAQLVNLLLERGLATRTANEYARTIRRADRWATARGLELRSLRAGDVVAFVATIPRTHSSRKVVRDALRHYWELSGRRSPPLRAIEVPKRKRMKCRALDDADARRLADVAGARGDAKGLMVLLGLYLALRREEIARLRWECFEARLDWVTVVGKGGVTATLPVHPVLLATLEATPPGRAGYVFPGFYGRDHVTPATVWNWTLEVARSAGLEHVPPHVLRHTCLATANDSTGDLRAVQDFARHASPDMTAGYTRVTTKRLIAVMASLDYGRAQEDGDHGSIDRLPA